MRTAVLGATMLSSSCALVARTSRLTWGPRPAGLCRWSRPPAALPCRAGFSTSASRAAPVPPVVWLVLRPITKLMAVLFGRSFRKWWQALPHNKRDLFRESVRRNRRKIVVAATGVAAVSLQYYYSHLQTTPLTGRTRFVAFTPEQFAQISEEMFELEVAGHGRSVLPTDHPAYRTVVRVANRLLSANGDLDEIHDKEWSVTVVDDANVQNAHVLPFGNIFVYTGMLEFCSNDDQLGCVLAHEMAHAVLGHGAERFSMAHLIDLLLILPLAAIWAFLPNDGISAFAHWFFRQMVKLLGDLPHSRELENEADDVGLQLAAKACFDVREASAFWSKMAVRRELEDELMVDWLSTHPADDSRRDNIDRQVPQLERARAQYQCGPLPARDPRSEVAEFRRLLEKQAAEERPVAVRLTVPGRPSPAAG